MKEIILLKDGEIALKGLNRHAFEDRLIKNARRKLMPVGSFHFKKAQSTIYVEPDREDYDLDEAVERLEAAGLREAVMASLTAALSEHLRRRAGEQMKIEAVVFSNRFGVLGRTPGADTLLALHREREELL